MVLQGIYILISLYGLYKWLFGGEHHTRLRVGRVGTKLGAPLAAAGIAATAGLTVYLRSVNDAAPFLDALTTVMSLVAQFLMSRKILEHWYVWIAADVIFIGLFASRGLYLTAVLYLIFLLMCLQGQKEWRNSLKEGSESRVARSEN
jgi:nicotinamide mononucleotide transporter